MPNSLLVSHSVNFTPCSLQSEIHELAGSMLHIYWYIHGSC